MNEAQDIDTITEGLQEAAGTAYACFETAHRHGNSERPYTRLRDDAPAWVMKIVFAAHDDGDLLPDDYRYAWTREALSAIHDASGDLDDLADEFADDVFDVWTTGDRARWLASHPSRVAYCDEAASEGCFVDDDQGVKGQGIMGRIGLGLYKERREVFGLVLDALRLHVSAP